MKALSYIFLAVSLVFVSSCKYNRPEEPKDAGDSPSVQLTSTHTVAALKNLYRGGATTIEEEVVVEAIMVSDDTEGNLYKSCYIADQTGGIELKLSMGNLSALYPQGSRIWLRAQGMTLGRYGEQINLGYRSLEPRYETAYYPEKLVPMALIKAGRGELSIKDRKIKTLSKADAGTLVRLEGVQFASSELGSTYASPENKVAQPNVNRNLVDASGNRLVVRTSSYAKFAGKTLPQGSGSITALLTYFRDTPQLLLLREADVAFNNPRF